MIWFRCFGTPAPKGSRKPVPIRKGGKQVGLRSIESNPNVKPWASDVSVEAMRAMMGTDPFLGPVEVHLVFVFSRPKYHYHWSKKRYGELKPDVPILHRVKPDGDKLERAVLDAMSGIVYRDDAQVAVGLRVKRYAGKCEVPGVFVSCEEVADVAGTIGILDPHAIFESPTGRSQ